AQSLLSGAHTRSISIPTPTSGSGIGIMKFAKKKATCLGCRVPLKNDESCLCSHCKENEAEIYQNLIVQRNYFENMYSRVWTQCQRCQGSLHQEVLCTARDCPVFYMRAKVKKDLADVQQKIDRFNHLTNDLDW